MTLLSRKTRGGLLFLAAALTGYLLPGLAGLLLEFLFAYSAALERLLDLTQGIQRDPLPGHRLENEGL